MYKKEHWVVASVTFLCVLTGYFITMAPSVTFWDAGEFVASSYILGVPHPPGTPLFVILGRVIAALPLPLPIAARLNFVSVFFGALTGFLIYLIAVKIIESWVEKTDSLAGRLIVHGGGFSAAVITCFMRTAWSNSTEFEVYTVATTTFVFCAWLMIYMGASHDERRIKRTLLLVIYLISLSIANHLIVLLVSPAVIIYTLIHDRRNWRYWSSILGLFFGFYLMVMKGVDLEAVFGRMHLASLSNPGLTVAIFRHVAAFFDVLFGIYHYIESPPAMFFGVLITAICLFWAWRQKALPFFGAALGLFLLGFSIHLYLLIRAGLSPAINEGNPENLKALWAVIGREQYGSSYGLFPRQVWALIREQSDVVSLSQLMENVKFFFKYNVPFYTQYFGWQYGNNLLSLAFFFIGIFGAIKHYRSEKKSFYFWLAVVLITGPILNTYMNFKLGYSQFNDQFPNQEWHEVRERDYFFMVSFAFYGVWSGLGLAAAANRLRELFHLGTPKPLLGGATFSALCLVVFLPSVVPFTFNYDEDDRSGNYIPANYARNIMNSMEPGGIIFTNGDNDTFPLWYIQEVEHVRRDCRVVNLSLLNTTWYIKQMRDMEPKVPISYGDEAIDQMIPMRLPKDVNFKFGEMDVNFPQGAAMYIKDIILLDILRTNKWNRPLYFTTTVPSSNRSGLDPYLTMQGAVFKINPRKAADLAAADSNLAPLPGRTDMYMDIAATRKLLYEVYDYDTFFRKGSSGEEANVRLSSHFAAPFAWLGQAYQQRNQLDKALEANLWARRFIEDPHQWDFLLAQLYARNKQYNESQAMMDSFISFSGPANPSLYNQLAQEAARNGDQFEAEKFLERAIVADPANRESYANLFMLYNAAGNKQSAVEILKRYLAQFPDDQPAREEFAKYEQTGEFDLAKVFGHSK